MTYDDRVQYQELDVANRAAIVRADGDMTDSQQIRLLIARSNRALRDGRCSAILLDVRDSAPVDTKLVAAVVLVCRTAYPRQCALYLLPSPLLRRWAEICQLDDLFDSITIYTASRRAARRTSSYPSARRCALPWQRADRSGRERQFIRPDVREGEA